MHSTAQRFKKKMASDRLFRAQINAVAQPRYLTTFDVVRAKAWHRSKVEELTELFSGDFNRIGRMASIDEALERIVAEYDQYCLLDCVAPPVEFSRGPWSYIKELPMPNEYSGSYAWSVRVFSDSLDTFCERDVFGYFFFRWTDYATVAAMNRLLLAFEKSARTHRLFSTPRRMAALLLTVACSDIDMYDQLIILLSLISDDAWRGIAALALRNDYKQIKIATNTNRVLDYVLCQICRQYGAHAFNDAEMELLRQSSENMYAAAIRINPVVAGNLDGRFDDEKYDTDSIMRYVNDNELMSRGSYEDYQSIDEDLLEDPDNNDFDEFIDSILDMLHRAGKRLCKGEIFRATTALVSQGDDSDINLPQYVILEIIKKTLPDCIFTNSAGDASGLLKQYEVVPIIEAVVNFRRRMLVEREQAPRSTRIRRPNENIDDDNE